MLCWTKYSSTEFTSNKKY